MVERFVSVRDYVFSLFTELVKHFNSNLKLVDLLHYLILKSIAEAYPELCQIFEMEHFVKFNEQLSTVNYFYKNTLS